jgi:hypothetical protein
MTEQTKYSQQTSAIYLKLNPTQQLRLRLFELEAIKDFDSAMQENRNLTEAFILLMCINNAKLLLRHDKLLTKPEKLDSATAVVNMCSGYLAGSCKKTLTEASIALLLWVSAYVKDPVLMSFYTVCFLPHKD